MVSGYSLELTHEEFLSLERVMLEKSEGGNVLYGKKTICIHGFHVEDFFLQENERHLNSICLREGASIWKKINKNF